MNDKEKALDLLTRYLAQRDHSERELRTKLSRRFEDEIIEDVLASAHEHGWLRPPEELASSATEAWNRSHKSHRYIQEQLRRKGLPATPMDEDVEREKVLYHLQKKFGAKPRLSYEDRTKAYRFLKYRGFDDGIIYKVINQLKTETL